MSDVAGPTGRRAVAARAVREAIGLPAIVLGASYLGFGSVVREGGMTLTQGLVSTATAWALPGQVVLVELWALGASVLAMALAVALTNARLFPMTVSLMPLLRHDGLRGWRLYVLANFVAVTGWTFTMRRAPEMPVADRSVYFLAFATTIWLASLACTAIGFVLAGAVPRSVALGLVFLNPLYFLLLFAAEARAPARALALGLGALAGPPLHLLSPDWGLMAAGVLAGTGAFVGMRIAARRKASA
jgi:predicted branched-subunit amino acid permease